MLQNRLEHEFETYGALRDVWVARNPPGFGFICLKIVAMLVML
eukprot:UN11207